MSDESKNGVNYKLKVSPEGMDTFTKLDEGVTKVNEGIKGMSEHLSSIGQVLSLTALKESMAGIQETLESIMKPSESFDAALKDFGTGANISGDALEEFGVQARNISNAMGGDVTGAILTAKTAISELNKELAKEPELLKGVTELAVIMSQTMGGDASTNLKEITAIMETYGKKTGDVTKDSEAFAEVIDQISQSALLGKEKLPELKLGFTAVGDAAAKAGLNIAETAASLQILNDHDFKGAAGGSALAGLAGGMSNPLSKDATASLSKAGVDVDTFANPLASLTDRLTALKPILNDTASLTLAFGAGNEKAGKALIENLDDLAKYTDGIQSSKSGLQDYTADNMNMFELMKAQGKSWANDMQISVGSFLGNFEPMGSALKKGVEGVSSLGMAVMGYSAIMDSAMIPSLTGGAMAAWGFVTSLAANGVQMVLNNIQLGVYAATMAVDFVGGALAATLAEWGFNAALYANPIGIVVAAIAGIVVVLASVAAAIYYYWDDIKAYFVEVGMFFIKLNPFYWIAQAVDYLFPTLKDTIKETFGKIVEWLEEVWGKIKGIYENIKKFFGAHLKASLTSTVDTQSAINAATSPGAVSASGTVPGKGGVDPIAAGLKNVAGGGGNQVRNVTTNIHGLVDTVNIIYQDMKLNPRKIKDEFVDLLDNSIRDAEVALAN